MASQAEQYQYQYHQQQQQRSQQTPLQYSQPTVDNQHNGQAKPRSYSLHSQKTHRSNGSKHEFHETHEEKEARRLHSKADPTLAMNEAEPSMVAAMKSETTQISIRSIQHKDTHGNLIADPDRSNPTRHRWERPLDTIRSFEAAIDGGYQRKSLYRADTDSVVHWNRRSSFNPASTPRFPQDSYYGGRPASYRTESQYGTPATPGTVRNSYYDAQHAGGGYNSGYDRGHGGRHASRDRVQRVPSESHYQVYGREQGVYPMPFKDRSYETVTSAAPSGGSEPAGYQTDPTSSDNSSIDRLSPAKRVEPVNDYGIGFSQPQAYEVPNFSVKKPANVHPLPAPPQSHHIGAQATSQPPVAMKRGSLLKRQSTQPQQESNPVEKRKSWLSRRFSKG